MAAKVATRENTKKDKDTSFTPYVVVSDSDNRRVYYGDGVQKATAERMAADMAVPCRAVELSQIGADNKVIAGSEVAEEDQVEEAVAA